MTLSSLEDRLAEACVFSHLSKTALSNLLRDAEICVAQPGQSITTQPNDYVVLIDGALDIVDSKTAKTTGRITAAGSVSCLYAIPKASHIAARAPSRYIALDGGLVDDHLGWAQLQVKSEASPSPTTPRFERCFDLRESPAFRHIPQPLIDGCVAAMQVINASAGDAIVRVGEDGDDFFIIDQGQADVWRPVSKSGELMRVARLQAGRFFGEEALLRDGVRNATVKMVTDGRLFRLSKKDFLKHIAAFVFEEVSAQEASQRLKQPRVELLDCRYASEHAISNIPGDRLMPLDQIRELACELDHDREYIVYCRSGRRSRTAAFLLNQMDLKACSLLGGIVDWPYQQTRRSP